MLHVAYFSLVHVKYSIEPKIVKIGCCGWHFRNLRATYTTSGHTVYNNTLTIRIRLPGLSWPRRQKALQWVDCSAPITYHLVILFQVIRCWYVHGKSRCCMRICQILVRELQRRPLGIWLYAFLSKELSLFWENISVFSLGLGDYIIMGHKVMMVFELSIINCDILY